MTKMILMNDFKQTNDTLAQSMLLATKRVIDSGWWVLGDEVKKFEADWANFVDCKYCIGVGNGMDALEIGIRALEINKGDEIITTAITAFATILAIIRAGATPVLADISAETGILDIQSVARCITPKTRAIMVVHLYGQAAPLDQFLALCSSHNLHLIEDAAQAHGAVFNGKKIGSFGSFAGWSFYPTKNLGAIGDAGALSTHNESTANNAFRLRNYGQSERYHHTDIGLNSRLDELQAAILSERLQYLSQWTERRRELAQTYSLNIQHDKITILPLPLAPERHVHHLFVITTPERKTLQNHLEHRNIQSLIHYPIPIHHQPPTHDIKRDPCGLKTAEQHAQQALSIPCHPALQNDEVAYIIDTLNTYQYHG